MTSISVNLCVGCIHLVRGGRLDTPGLSPSDDDPTTPRVCAAFPNKIPTEIWDGSVDHRQPYAGDHGIRYDELLAGTADRYDRHAIIERERRRGHRSDRPGR